MKKLLMIIPLVFLLCFTFSCQDKEAMAELEEMKAQAEVEEQNKELVIEWLEQWDLGNFAIADKLIADNFVLHVPGAADIKGAGEFIESGKPLYAAFPDYKHIVVDAFAKGDKVVVRFEPQGTHEGEFMGVPPTGRQVKYTAIAIYKFKEGKCVEIWVDADNLGLMMQLGMELRPKSNIQISHAMGLAGHDITVTVTAGGDERIMNVRTVYDRRTIGNDSLKPPHSWYKREFAQVGGYTPSVKHTVFVEVTSTIGRETASLIWTDQ